MKIFLTCIYLTSYIVIYKVDNSINKANLNSSCSLPKMLEYLDRKLTVCVDGFTLAR
jgi:hypothetical protein